MNFLIKQQQQPTLCRSFFPVLRKNLDKHGKWIVCLLVPQSKHIHFNVTERLLSFFSHYICVAKYRFRASIMHLVRVLCTCIVYTIEVQWSVEFQVISRVNLLKSELQNSFKVSFSFIIFELQQQLLQPSSFYKLHIIFSVSFNAIRHDYLQSNYFVTKYAHYESEFHSILTVFIWYHTNNCWCWSVDLKRYECVLFYWCVFVLTPFQAKKKKEWCACSHVAMIIPFTCRQYHRIRIERRIPCDRSRHLIGF